MLAGVKGSRSLRRQRLENELGGHLDGRLQTAVDGAPVREEGMNANGGPAMRLLGSQPEPHADTADHEHLVLQLNLPYRLGYEASRGCIDLTRLQRASKGSRQSTRGRGDDVIERRGTGLGDILGNFVMLGDGPVDAEDTGSVSAGR